MTFRDMTSSEPAAEAAAAAINAPTMVVISQVYAPDPAAVGQHITDVAEAMAARGWRVIVYTANRGYDHPLHVYARHEVRNGVVVRRLPFSSFGKQSIAVRLFAGLLFLVQAITAVVWVRRVTVVLVSTSPPFAHIAGLALRALRGIPFIWWVMDVNPDQLVAAGRVVQTSLAARLLEATNRAALRSASAVVVLDRFMRQRMLAKGAVIDTLQTIRPWSHNRAVNARDLEGNPFRIQHGLQGSFVVMYSGNHAIQHPLETLLAAADQLNNDDSIRFVFVGGGAGKRLVEEKIRCGARNILSLPFQPREALPTSLAAADMHVVSMADNVVGIVHPCKIYGALAAGRSIMFFGPAESHVGDLLRGTDYGVVIRHGDVGHAIKRIRQQQALTPEERFKIGQEAQIALAEIDVRDNPLLAMCQIICGTHSPRYPAQSRG